MDKIPMTTAGFNALEAELKNLKSVERPAVIEAIAEARAHGDLSENAEYSAARERQSFIEGRIQDLEGAISLANIIDPLSFVGDKAVKMPQGESRQFRSPLPKRRSKTPVSAVRRRS